MSVSAHINAAPATPTCVSPDLEGQTARPGLFRGGVAYLHNFAGRTDLDGERVWVLGADTTDRVRVRVLRENRPHSCRFLYKLGAVGMTCWAALWCALLEISRRRQAPEEPPSPALSETLVF